jgi:cytidylate kinase
MAVITISREVGSGGDEIARRVGEVLGYRLFSRTLMAEVARQQALSEAEIVDFSEDSYRARGFIDALLRRSAPIATTTVRATTTTGEEVRVSEHLDEEMAADFVATTIRALAKRGQVVIVGRGGQAILRDQPGMLHVRVIARPEDRLQRTQEVESLPPDKASKLIAECDRAVAQYVRHFHGVEWADPEWADPLLYHLTLNTSLLSPETAVELIAAAARQQDAQASAPPA